MQLYHIRYGYIEIVMKMTQHFLLSSKARTLSLAQVMRLTDAEAFDLFVAIRWADNGGQPNCPKCGCLEIYRYAARRIFKCKGCQAQFSATSGTIFASRKLEIRDVLAAIAIFANGAKGISALQLSRDIDCQYRTAYVLAHKLREAMASETANVMLSGTVEIDGAYFGGHVKPANFKEVRKDRRLAENQTGKRRCVVVTGTNNWTPSAWGPVIFSSGTSYLVFRNSSPPTNQLANMLRLQENFGGSGNMGNSPD